MPATLDHEKDLLAELRALEAGRGCRPTGRELAMWTAHELAGAPWNYLPSEILDNPAISRAERLGLISEGEVLEWALHVQGEPEDAILAGQEADRTYSLFREGAA